MRLIESDSLVLHSFDYGETSRIVRIATRDAGVLSVIARGARRPKSAFGAAIDLFTSGVAHVRAHPARDLHTLAGFDTTRTRSELAGSLQRFTAASAIAELCLRFGREDDSGRVHDGATLVLDAIGAAPPGDVAAIALAGAWRVVADLGFAPSLDQCASCHADLAPDAAVTFDHRAGGALCANCARLGPRGRQLPAEARETLRRWLGGTESALEDPSARRAHQRLLREFLEEHLGDGRPLRAFVAWEGQAASRSGGCRSSFRVILGTAGHIDHGKTTLVRALTGVDTDRLPEEKRRGITIELGFAPLAISDEVFSGTLGVVDVPGHDAFVRTMLAGATGVDLALLVIAADEGVMPQTREHLAILTLLGVRGGVVALTKSDLADADWLALVTDDVSKLLAGSALAAAAIVPCSATTGAGLPELRHALAMAAAAVPARSAADLMRLPLDRAFTVKGTGTVVTGTLWSGAIARDATMRIFPGGETARVRSVESHGASVDRGLPGTRVAVALAGVERERVSHGAVLVSGDDSWRESAALRADVALLDGAKPLGVRTRVRFHLGTSEVGARLVAAGGSLEAGAIRPVRITLDTPVVARAGDRFVLRTASPPMTIGGGVVTDPQPAARRAKPWPTAGAGDHVRLAWIAAECAGDGLALADLPVRIGVVPGAVGHLVSATRSVVALGDRVYDVALRAHLRDRLAADVRAWHKANPLEAGLPLQQARSRLRAREALFDDLVRDLVDRAKVELRGSVLARAGWKAGGGAGAAKLAELAVALEAGGVSPLSVSELTDQFGKETPALLRVLEREGRAVAVAADRFYAPAALTSLIESLRAATSDGTQKTASQIREALGLSRKYLIPFLEYCDRTGISARHGDLRSFHWKP